MAACSPAGWQGGRKVQASLRAQAKQSRATKEDWIASSQVLLAMSLIPLPQPRQHLQAAVTVRRRDAHFGLVIPDCRHGVVADAAVGAAGVKTSFGQAGLHFLNLGERQRAFGAGERLDQRWAAENSVAEMADRQRIVHGGIVAAYRIEIRTEQE